MLLAKLVLMGQTMFGIYAPVIDWDPFYAPTVTTGYVVTDCSSGKCDP